MPVINMTGYVPNMTVNSVVKKMTFSNLTFIALY
jgi:hypothetical protein